jgi:predicted RNA binding protein YcfA (HicA-like mRNA interferase family)
MSKRLPRLTSEKLVRVLKKKGFMVARQSGSHMILKNEKGIRITVPVHSGTIVHPKILKRIMEDAELSEDDF